MSEYLRPFEVYSRFAEDEGSMLVFAHDHNEARLAAWKFGWFFSDDGFVDIRARSIREHAEWFLLNASDPNKVGRDEAHVIDDPPYCKQCERWGRPIGPDGYCDDCRDWLAAFYREAA